VIEEQDIVYEEQDNDLPVLVYKDAVILLALS